MTYFQRVREFHEAAKIPVRNRPTELTRERLTLRLSLITEEYAETVKALLEGNLVETADGIADLIVVLCGTALEMGLPLDEVFAEVHRANMSKIEGAVWRGDGKLLKGPNYAPPNVATIIAEARYGMHT